MRIRLWSLLILAGLVLGAILIPWNRVPARDAQAPACDGLVPLNDPPAAEAGCLPAPQRVLHGAEHRAEAASGCVALPSLCGTKPADCNKVGTVPTLTVNSRRIRLNFNITDVGPSGVSSVELWATRDGQTWQRYSSEPPPTGPLVVQVAEEGRYGFSLVVKSGVGVGSPPPRAGDAPQLWVEVDETRPKVRLLNAEVGKGRQADQLTLTWLASDANLLPHPITISMSGSKDGPWTPVANNLENTGKYVWYMPGKVPYQFFVRVEATDRAGNCSVDCCPEPMKVDRACPKGTILGIDAEKKKAASVPPPSADNQVFNFWMGFTR